MSAPFTSQEYQALLQELESLADPQYKAFHEGLIPGVSMAWGVRLPALRGLAKKLLRGDPVGFLEKTQPGSYEETLLRGLVIGGLNLPWEGKRPWVEDFLPRIDNWAVCDTFCNSLKPALRRTGGECGRFSAPCTPAGRSTSPGPPVWCSSPTLWTRSM